MPKRQKGNLSPNPNNEAGLSSITTRNIIGYVSDLMVIGFIVNFGTYFNKIEIEIREVKHGDTEARRKKMKAEEWRMKMDWRIENR